SFAPDAGACGSSLAFTLDVSNQVGWRVLPKLHATVSNSPGSEGVVTMIDPTPPNHANIQAQVGGVTTTIKVYLP
ncbi:MAG: hypothetical protein ACYC8T_30990, partial [Myxococcaceae bacterium]